MDASYPDLEDAELQSFLNLDAQPSDISNLEIGFQDLQLPDGALDIDTGDLALDLGGLLFDRGLDGFPEQLFDRGLDGFPEQLFDRGLDGFPEQLSDLRSDLASLQDSTFPDISPDLEPPPECEEGQRELQGCAEDREQSRFCKEGYWSTWSDCGVECQAEELQVQICAGEQNQQRGCQEGRWCAWSECGQLFEECLVCPEAILEEDRLAGEPLAQMLFNAGASQGELQAWEWSLVSKPEGSFSQMMESFRIPEYPQFGGLEDDPSTPEARFFFDLIGDYHFELRVRGEQDLGARCPSAFKHLHVEIKPTSAVYIQLTWKIEDPDPEDIRGSDLDLHLLHPSASAWETDGDCYHAHFSPDWGAEGPEGNPQFDIDDRNNYGPENIRLEIPEILEAPYLIGVHYFRDWAELGESEAILAFYLEGSLIGEWRRFLVEDEFWSVIGFNWGPTPEFILQDQLTQGIPGNSIR